MIVNRLQHLVVKVRTAWALGPRSILAVMRYRFLLRSGLHPVQRLGSPTPAGSEFFVAPDNLRMDLPPPRESWWSHRMAFGIPGSPIEGAPPDWHVSCLNGKRGDSVSPWWKIGDFDRELGDIKGVWEASRFDWVLPAAQRAAVGEMAGLRRLNDWLTDWVSKNPSYRGVNWKCGQEASIRVMHLATALLILGQECAATADLLDLIELHLRRIAPTTAYARGQNNNHGTSEGAGLFIGGTLLEANGRATGAGYARKGRALLEDRVETLFQSDGSFSQSSATYHRLALDTLVLAEIWRRRIGAPAFSATFMRRARAAMSWLHAMTDPVSGDAPNLGSNDGAMLIALADTAYRDFRPSLQLAAAVLEQRLAIEESGPWDTPLAWFDISRPQAKFDQPGSAHFPDGGFVVLRRGKAMAVLRYPRFSFRPSQADALHLDLFVGGINYFRDAGSYSYNAGEEVSRYFSGTEGHNTVMFDDRDQMPRVSRFLFGDWLNTSAVISLTETGEIIRFGAEYVDGRGACHRRHVTLSPDELRVTDTVSGFADKAVLRWRLAPADWRLSGQETTNGNARLSVSADEPLARIELNEGWESRYYCAKTKLPVLEAEVTRPGTLTSVFRWAG